MLVGVLQTCQRLYIYTEDDGQLVIEGTASNRVTITGEFKRKNNVRTRTELNSSVASTIKFVDFINSNVNGWDYMIKSQDGSTIEMLLLVVVDTEYIR